MAVFIFVRIERIELSPDAWEGRVLPLNSCTYFDMALFAVRDTRIELVSVAWEATILPLN